MRSNAAEKEKKRKPSPPSLVKSHFPRIISVSIELLSKMLPYPESEENHTNKQAI
jgi:hypothetical protein